LNHRCARHRYHRRVYGRIGSTARAGDGELVIEVSAGGRTQNTGLTEKVTTKAADAMEGARQTVIRVAEEFVSAVDEMETRNRPNSCR
jgi:hypothetical protein